MDIEFEENTITALQINKIIDLQKEDDNSIAITFSQEVKVIDPNFYAYLMLLYNSGYTICLKFMENSLANTTDFYYQTMQYITYLSVINSRCNNKDEIKQIIQVKFKDDEASIVKNITNKSRGIGYSHWR